MRAKHARIGEISVERPRKSLCRILSKKCTSAAFDARRRPLAGCRGGADVPAGSSLVKENPWQDQYFSMIEIFVVCICTYGRNLREYNKRHRPPKCDTRPISTIKSRNKMAVWEREIVRAVAARAHCMVMAAAAT
ncbi:hypothetical protein EVAR_64181_1 [Eumeta japonica]|uniref:Uncharacterized protein n=1 Tax=Eumeta variegata TaxID=151549 RepID=A0A4C1ZIM8_EUMVA|nr:hypothetical protein EVAR_64181_1 [Eumeta japonica]